MKRCLALLLLSALPLGASAQSLFGSEWAEGHELPKTFGVGADMFSMHQDYDIASLQFTLPGVDLADPSVIKVENRAWNVDVKLDAWLLPFLNVFAILGHVEGDTDVDLRAVDIPGAPAGVLGQLPISYDGRVYGGGLTLAYGSERWFASLTGSWSRSSLSGDFDSSVRAKTWQPRIGLVRDDWRFWVGGFYLDATEKHAGSIALPGIGTVPFAVELESSNKFNPTLGIGYDFARNAELSVEFGHGGDRTMTLANFTWRFGD